MTLREQFESSSADGTFLLGVELVSTRGTMAEAAARRARDFSRDLVENPSIHWISITDNAGGNPMLAPPALGKPILYAGKEVVIHLTCKDMNRNGLESEAWSLESEGFHNILAMTGDYPVAGSDGAAKPVFDIDSVGLISLLDRMNRGVHADCNGNGRLGPTRFFVGAVTTNFKLLEGEVMPQYYKLEKKIRCGARFIINQIGYDARKMHELIATMRLWGLGEVPLVGNVYVLNPTVARLFHRGRIPGVVVTDPLLELCERHGRSPDGGTAFFQELAAKQIAVYRGLGYRAAYLGGVHSSSEVEKILEIERSFAADDWKGFVADFCYSRPREFYYLGLDAETGLADPGRVHDPRSEADSTRRSRIPVGYRASKWAHERLFEPGTRAARWGEALCRNARDDRQGPAPLRMLERVSKSLMFACRDCGDCSLPEIAFLCPESQCAKNQRNGPCGGTREGRCEVDGFGDCIWLRAYERRRREGTERELLAHVPIVQNQGLRGTSSWANHWLGRDHTARSRVSDAPGESEESGLGQARGARPAVRKEQAV